MTGSDKLKILIVTNSGFLNDTFKKFLNNKIIDVSVCPNGLQCIKYAVETNPSLIFIDVNLAGFSSLDTIKVLNSLNVMKMVPTVVMLAYSQANILGGLIDLGISTMLYKPFNRNEVLNVVNSLLADKIKEKTETLSAIDIVRVNAELNKSAAASKMEQINKIQTLKEFVKNKDNIKEHTIAALSSRDSDGLIKIFNLIKTTGYTINNQRIFLICDFVLNRLTDDTGLRDWNEINKYTNEVLDLLGNVKVEFR